MTQVKFLVDYRGKLTEEQFYQAGAIADFDAAIAARLVEDERAELVEPEPTRVRTRKA